MTLLIHPHELLLAAGDSAPQVTLQDTRGRAVQLGGAMKTATAIEFASAACVPCSDGARTLCSLTPSPSWRFVVVDAAHDSAAAFSAVASAAGCSPLTVLDPQLEASRRYGVTAVPTYYVVDSNGKIKFSGAGSDGLQGAVAALRRG